MASGRSRVTSAITGPAEAAWPVSLSASSATGSLRSPTPSLAVPPSSAAPPSFTLMSCKASPTTPAGSAVLAGQPGLLVLDQLEQGGLDLLHLGDLGQDQLAVLTRRLHDEPSAAEQPVDQSVRERHIADPDQRKIAPRPRQDALAQPQPAVGQLVACRPPAQDRDQEPDDRRGQRHRRDSEPGYRRIATRRQQYHHGNGGRHDDRQYEDGPHQCLPVRVQLQDEPLALGEGTFTGHRPHRGMYIRSKLPRRVTAWTTSPALTETPPVADSITRRPVASTSRAVPVMAVPPGSDTRAVLPRVPQRRW